MIGAGIAIGARLGTARGAAMDNIAIGLALEVGVGIAIAAALEQRRKGRRTRRPYRLRARYGNRGYPQI
jgi:hypothetical protein